jgi:signal transduction histidine kinase
MLRNAGQMVTSPNPEARFDRDSWLVAAAAAGYLAISLILMLLEIGLPADGWHYDNSAESHGLLALQNISGAASPLQPGDVVVRVEGQALAPLLASFQPATATAAWRVGGTARYTVLRNDQTLDLAVPLVAHSLLYMGRIAFSQEIWIASLANFANLALALFVFVRRPRNFGARALLLVFAMWFGAETSVQDYNAVAGYFTPPAHFYASTFWGLSCWGWILSSLITFVLVFPVRKGPLRRHARRTLVLLYGLPAALTLLALAAGRAEIFFVTLGVLVAVFLATTLVSTIHTLRTNRDPIVRAQLGWVFLGLMLTVGLGLVSFQIGIWFPESALNKLPQLGDAISQLIFPICTAIAILRYRLFDIDLLINRALVYLVLTAGVVGVYVLVVSYLGTLFRTQDDLVLSLIATSLVAVLFAPARDWVQRSVNRLMYGERDEPYRLLTRLGQQLAITQEPTLALAQTVETVARALKLPYVAITLKQGERQQRIATYGDALPTVSRYPLLYASEAIGELEAATRNTHEMFTPADERLLRDLARQIGVAAHAAQLTADLQQSRTRLVTAREEERRRIRRDLHDGLGPTLANMAIRLEQARESLPLAAGEADVILAQLTLQAQTTIADIRRLVYELRPPDLDEYGLVPALREYLHRMQPKGTSLTLDAPETLPTLPAAVEVAAYRIVQEAVNNAVRHARASRITVTLALQPGAASPRSLVVATCDNGVGLPAAHPVGIGLHSMRERAEELGGHCVIGNSPDGGVQVVAALPLS